MSWYQLIYDMTLFNSAIDVGNYPILYISYLGQFSGGIGSSIMSNWIAFILFYVVIYEKSFDIIRNYSFILLSSVIISIPTVIVYSIGALPEGSNPLYVDIAGSYLYFYTRVISIALNFIMIGFIVYKNYQVRSKSSTKTPAEIAINTLCRRVMYYPILQTISRSGYAWYESQYGFDFRVSEAEHNQSRYAALMFTAIITPTVSVGYLILFLTIEPNAYDCFKEIFCCSGSSSSSKTQHNENTTTTTTNNDKSQNDSLTTSSNFDSATATTNNTSDPSNMCELNNSNGIRESIIVSENNRLTDYRYNGESSMYRYSWNVFRSSITNFFIPTDEIDYYNRTEDEIFAIINESQSSIIQLNGSITISNPLRSSINNNNHKNNTNNDNDDLVFHNL
jgi:hypothetical protein